MSDLERNLMKSHAEYSGKGAEVDADQITKYLSSFGIETGILRPTARDNGLPESMRRPRLQDNVRQPFFSLVAACGAAGWAGQKVRWAEP